MAETLLIRALSWAAEIAPDLTNIAKVQGSKYLVPALPFKDGPAICYGDITNALFVKVTPGSLKGRIAPSGEALDLELAMRCNRWWRLGQCRRRGDDVRLLVAVSAHTKPSRIIGVWRTLPVSEWWFEDQAQPSVRIDDERPWNGPSPIYQDRPASGWVVGLESVDPNINDWQGREFDWGDYRPQGVGYSADITTSWVR
jgi:hypothetical protein